MADSVADGIAEVDTTSQVINSYDDGADAVSRLLENMAPGTTFDGEDAITVAARLGYTDIVKYLIERMYISSDDCGEALREAVEYGYIDIVMYLVEHGTSVYEVYDDQLDVALEEEYIDVIVYLMGKGLDVAEMCDLDRYDIEYLLSSVGVDQLRPLLSSSNRVVKSVAKKMIKSYSE